MIRVTFIALLFIALIAWLTVMPCVLHLPFQIDVTKSAYCDGFKSIPGNLPTSLVEVFVLGVFFATFPALLGIAANRSSSSKSGSVHIKNQFTSIVDSIFVLLTDENADRAEEFRNIKDTFKAFKNEKNLAIYLFSNDQRLLYHEFRSSFLDLLEDVPKTAAATNKTVAEKVYNSTENFEICAVKLKKLLCSAQFAPFGFAKLIKLGQNLDQLICDKYSDEIAVDGNDDEIELSEKLSYLLVKSPIAYQA